MDLFFSVIIPTLNEEDYLPLLLNDFSRQKEKNFEVIIADGVSVDETKGRALQFENKFPLYFYENERKNVSFQRNFGAGKAKGKYLVFLDADARVKPSFTKSLMSVILKKKGLVFIPYIIPDVKNTETEFIFKIINFLTDFLRYVGKPFSNGGNMFWEKNFFRAVGGFNEKLYLAEDHNIILKAYQWGVRAKFLDQIKVEFSLRRIKREGRWALFYKYVLAAGYLLLKGDIKKKIFEYEMGGGTDISLKKRSFSKQNFKQLKQFFEQDIS